MSCVAKPLPANSTSIQPSRTSRATSGPAPVWMTAGPHDEQLAPSASRAPDAPRDLGDEQPLRLLARHLRGHERERVGRRPRLPAPVRAASRAGRTRTPVVPDDDEVAAARRGPSARRAPTPIGRDDERAVHLRALDVEPAPVDLHRRRQVRRRVEAAREDAVRRCRLDGARRARRRMRAVGVQLDEERSSASSTRRSSRCARATGRCGPADLDLEQPVVGARVDDDVEDLGRISESMMCPVTSTTTLALTQPVCREWPRECPAS